MGIELHISTSFHPQTAAWSERSIQTLGDMLRACNLDYWGSWDQYLALIDFAYPIAIAQATIWLPVRPCMVVDVKL